MMKIIGSGVVSRGLAGDVRGAVTGVLTGFLLCCVAVPSLGHHISARMVENTTALIDATAGLPQVINPGTLRYSFDDSERVDLDFVPKAMQAPRGMAIGNMPLPARLAAHDLLRDVLSEQGYLLANHIMLMDDVLRHSETWSAARLSDDYRYEVFGEPGPESPWGWKVEGHHLSVNVTSLGDEVRATPLFLGTNPALVAAGPRAGLRIMVPHQAAGLALLASLNDMQLARAHTAADVGRGGLQRGARQPQAGSGVSAALFDDAQLALVETLLETWARSLRADLAITELAEIRNSGLEQLTFEWRGSLDPTLRHYWALRGPNVVIEFDALPNAGSEKVNHLHSVWSNPERDYGVDLLQRHYQEDH